MAYSEVISTVNAQREIRGSDERCWSDLQVINEIGRKVRVSKGIVGRRIISSGDCEGLWRVYYSAASTDTFDKSRHEAPVYMGRPLPESCTKIELGILFENWIKQANKAYNRFLRNRNLAEFNALEIPQIRNFFYQRAEAHLKLAPNHGLLAFCEMDCSPNLGPFPGLPVANLNPDGMFLKGTTGAVFESKMARPMYERFKCELAAYALLAERCKGIPVDYAIVLHANYPDERLEVRRIQIADSYAREVLKNVYKFGKLLQFSLAERHIPFANGGGGSVPLRKVIPFLELLKKGGPIRPFKTWKELLVRPPGMPSKAGMMLCSRCEFSTRCFAEGGSNDRIHSSQ